MAAGKKYRLFITDVDSINELYDQKTPTTRAILKLMTAFMITEHETKAFNYTKKYVESLDDASLKKFLWFVTSDMVCVTEIGVSFFRPATANNTHPVAHTC